MNSESLTIGQAGLQRYNSSDDKEEYEWLDADSLPLELLYAALTDDGLIGLHSRHGSGIFGIETDNGTGDGEIWDSFFLDKQAMPLNSNSHIGEAGAVFPLGRISSFLAPVESFEFLPEPEIVEIRALFALT